ncbi:BlaR1 family beta-lactam sensor/signal transducer [Halobacillus sp. A5]|uniref:BlaR1 family beta-lactam sensor/signal transducer n=1 Tax=Halobacillus sp. A5 TaxID=2880263 RepID=UPI0020A6C759|nr:BlaR1 family beta-lactam sensor/signal transducer [Halobacillus sp. A5]MCP3028696.1 BlaR1 family beta-lactam sensor/signal transducer [Halobacillus sp. A5]
MSALHLAVSLFISSIVVIGIMLIRKVFKNQLSSKWKYNLWFLLLIALLIPYLPTQSLRFGGKFTGNENQNSNQAQAGFTTETPESNNGNWMDDFSTSVHRFDFTVLDPVLTIIWIAGMFVMIVLAMHAWIKLWQIKKSASALTNNEVLSLFEQCKQRLNVSHPLVLAESQLIKSPMMFGIFNPCIILPRHAEVWLSTDEMKYILLHELHHYKKKDTATNYLTVLFQILYWFNPFIWIAFKEMRLDREIACDSAVLHTLDQHQHAAYGNTIIKFADKSYLTRHFAMVNLIASSKKQIKKRIEGIASFASDTNLVKVKSILIFMLLAGFVVCQIPIVSAMPYEDRIDFDKEQTVYEDLSASFNGYEGSFVLYDFREKQYNIYNKDKSTLRVSPNSTYKIYSALFALESEVITPNDNFMKWNGQLYPYQSWNKNQNLYAAMENSVTWYFQQMDKMVQKKNIETYTERIEYGNHNLSGGIEDYWLESSLKISPIEQVQTLKEFYANQFGFDGKNIHYVKDSIKLETKESSTLYGKTGTGTVNGKNVNGWFIGFVERENNTHFFATNIENDNQASGSIAADITKSILHNKGIY